MFTGIVEATGEVRDVEDTADGRRLRIGTDFSDLSHGQSISVSGACLTVEESVDGEWFSVFLAEETVDRTYFDDLSEGTLVNLERAMRADGRFDGHIVQGHVDATATVRGVERVGGDGAAGNGDGGGEAPDSEEGDGGETGDGDWRFTFSLPADVERYVVEKGSITVDGISLTVADRDEDSVDVAIIPTTYDLTTLSEKAIGDPVHLEIDVVAKYIERLV